MTESDTTQILEELKEIRTSMVEFRTSVENRLEHLEKSVQHLEISVEKSEAYRQGTQWVVNLAFSLIVATTIGIILRFVLGS